MEAMQRLSWNLNASLNNNKKNLVIEVIESVPRLSQHVVTMETMETTGATGGSPCPLHS